jgi:hypothetical protein
MENSVTPKPIYCYIGASKHPVSDPFLAGQGLTAGMIFFGIPAFGVQFKCRADGDLIALEFGAFFSLLKTITDSLKDQEIRAIRVFSSNPEFVFSFTGKGRHLAKGTEREKMLRGYAKSLQITISYIPPAKNRALLSPTAYPAVPRGREMYMKPNMTDMLRGTIKPFQRGIKL